MIEDWHGKCNLAFDTAAYACAQVLCTICAKTHHAILYPRSNNILNVLLRHTHLSHIKHEHCHHHQQQQQHQHDFFTSPNTANDFQQRSILTTRLRVITILHYLINLSSIIPLFDFDLLLLLALEQRNCLVFLPSIIIIITALFLLLLLDDYQILLQTQTTLITTTSTSRILPHLNQYP